MPTLFVSPALNSACVTKAVFIPNSSILHPSKRVDCLIPLASFHMDPSDFHQWKPKRKHDMKLKVCQCVHVKDAGYHRNFWHEQIENFFHIFLHGIKYIDRKYHFHQNTEFCLNFIKIKLIQGIVQSYTNQNVRLNWKQSKLFAELGWKIDLKFS